jgi:hypothetical protein
MMKTKILDGRIRQQNSLINNYDILYIKKGLLMKEAITAAEQKKFSEFSKKVKTSLEDKLRNHPKVKSAQASIEDMESIKAKFAEIEKSNMTKTEPTDTDTPEKETPEE